MRHHNEQPEHIEKLGVPDEDVQRWMEVLREEGWDEEAIGKFIANLNRAYSDAQGHHAFEINDEFKELLNTYREVGRELTREEKDHLHAHVVRRHGNKKEKK